MKNEEFLFNCKQCVLQESVLVFVISFFIGIKEELQMTKKIH